MMRVQTSLNPTLLKSIQLKTFEYTSSQWPLFNRVCCILLEYQKENSETIDAQPQVLTDSEIEAQHLDNDSLPDAMRLMNINEKMKRRKIKAVIRYHKPNKHKEP